MRIAIEDILPELLGAGLLVWAYVEGLRTKSRTLSLSKIWSDYATCLALVTAGALVIGCVVALCSLQSIEVSLSGMSASVPLLSVPLFCIGAAVVVLFLAASLWNDANGHRFGFQRFLDFIENQKRSSEDTDKR